SSILPTRHTTGPENCAVRWTWISFKRRINYRCGTNSGLQRAFFKPLRISLPWLPGQSKDMMAPIKVFYEMPFRASTTGLDAKYLMMRSIGPFPRAHEIVHREAGADLWTFLHR